MAGDPAYQSLLRRLEKAKTKDLHAASNTSLRAVGKLVKGAIVARAPIEEGKPRGSWKPGSLKAGFRVKVNLASDESAVVDGAKDRVYIGPKKGIRGLASMIENGHENRRGKKGSKAQTKHGRAPAYPFVRPAWDATRDEAVTLYQQTMAEEVKKAFNDEH